MSLIPDQKKSININLAPMIDFLFLMLAFFATLAITRAAIFDTKLTLVSLKKEKNTEMVVNKENISQINLSIDQKGQYKWITEICDYPMENLKKVQSEIFHQYNIGIIPKEKTKTKILLHIDERAPWDAVAKLIFAVREVGFEAFPIYKEAR